jgi:putative membrane protein
MMWWYPGEHMSGWGWAAMSIGMILFWVLLILGGVLLFRGLNRPPGVPAVPPRPTADQLLAERFARGEIDEDEYRRRLEALQAASAGYATKP